MRSKNIFKLFSVMLMVMMLLVLPGCGSGSAEDQTQEDVNTDETGAYTELFEYDGLVMSVGQNYEDEESGNYMIEIHGANGSETSYSFRVEGTANGYPIHSYQSLILAAGNEAGYSYAVPTSVLKEYGIENIGRVDYRIIVNEFDMENFETGEQVYVSDTYTIKTDKYEEMSTTVTSEKTIYEGNEIKYNLILKEGQPYASMCIFAENMSKEEATVEISELYLNGEPLDIQSAAEVYTFDIEGSGSKFARLPIQNYIYDEEKMETTVIPVETLELVLTITIGDNTFTTDRLAYNKE